jgi:hypothetical protein
MVHLWSIHLAVVLKMVLALRNNGKLLTLNRLAKSPRLNTAKPKFIQLALL